MALLMAAALATQQQQLKETAVVVGVVGVSSRKGSQG
jgi:hypothetical protein